MEKVKRLFNKDNMRLAIVILICVAFVVRQIDRIIILVENNLTSYGPLINDIIFYIILSLLSIVFFIYLIKYKEDILDKAALYAVSKAEEEWGSKTGQIKFVEVYTYLKKNYPLITFFISEEDLKDIIEEALNVLKSIIKEKEKKVSELIEEK